LAIDGTVEHSVLLDLVADLPAGQETMLLHVVECESCRAEVVRWFGSLRQEADCTLAERIQDLAATGLPAVAQRVQATPEAEALAARLTGLAPGAQSVALGDPKYHSAGLLEAVLQQAAAAQPEDPARSVSLAILAGRLASLCNDCELAPGDAVFVQVQAGILAGGSHRLLGGWSEAEECLSRAGGALLHFPQMIPEKLLWWCQLGLLRWEQGKLDEAEPLLRQAVRCAGELLLRDREGALRVLLGLLCLERGETERAARLFQAGRVALADAPDHHPWLFLRAGLNFAVCLAESKDHTLARRVFAETLPHYSLAGEAERMRLLRLEGKLSTRLGRPVEGMHLLARAWRHLLAEDSLGEAAVCFLDLAEAMADAKQGAEVPALLREMQAALAGWGGEPRADLQDRMEIYTTAICKTGRKLRKSVAATAVSGLRWLFRSRGHRVEALPYA
jgi:tetratricopeptide (TPR) repeat protein